jgi:hypothetical protein
MGRSGWQRRPLPASFDDSVHGARLDAVDSGGFLLTASPEDGDAPRMARWDDTRWTAEDCTASDGRALHRVTAQLVEDAPAMLSRCSGTAADRHVCAAARCTASTGFPRASEPAVEDASCYDHRL